jgi:hypothetical protein
VAWLGEVSVATERHYCQVAFRYDDHDRRTDALDSGRPDEEPIMSARPRSTPPAPSSHDRAYAVGRRLMHELRPDPRAWSVNGREVVFVAGFDLEVEIGGFLTIDLNDGDLVDGDLDHGDLDDGTRLLVQVHERHLAERSLARVDVDAEAFSDALATDTPGAGSMVRSASVDMTARFVEGTGRVLGRLTPDGLVAGGFDGDMQAELFAADRDGGSEVLLQQWLAAGKGDAAAGDGKATLGSRQTRARRLDRGRGPLRAPLGVSGSS